MRKKKKKEREREREYTFDTVYELYLLACQVIVTVGNLAFMRRRSGANYFVDADIKFDFVNLDDNGGW